MASPLEVERVEKIYPLANYEERRSSCWAKAFVSIGIVLSCAALFLFARHRVVRSKENVSKELSPIAQDLPATLTAAPSCFVVSNAETNADAGSEGNQFDGG